ncbi:MULTISPECIES: restriction endonuclease subunit S [unclassified Proteus (in: enterobacteria)]|uniref:restriction endonuclease subunit S n=1 Tax=unclassified Proteus (in: enterobacteria) TaxID=257482 RepID=UPI00137694AD|nr:MULTISPECIES: restriction endonuclease subunit S [unclassified Proteus (in: enterobacteria)]NBM01846.1 restriction endonuclease subunit S [Proteus sp. G2671]NBM93074.1 restriction endonuclease subunit S [Proteus sp. G2662]NBN25289.1 restriction endonuclease subunit S [Proteus sp. G2657]
MCADKKVPDIRFKGFSEEWDCLILGENANFTKGQGYSKGDLVTNGVPIILYGRLYTRYQTVITAVDTFVTEKDKSVKSIGGEVIVPASGESPEDISRASVVSEPNIILGGDLNIVLPNKKVNPTFLALAMSMGRLKKILSSKAQGKSVVHIRNSDLADLDIILPSEKPEQTTIGNYFQKLDNLINQHQQKHDKLSNIKKAMLEKMFPKPGKTVPEIRFKGFSSVWKEKIIYELFTVTRGNVLPTTKTSPLPTADKCYPVYSSQTKNNGLMGFYDEYLFKDAITWTTDGANAGTVNFREGKFYSTNVNGVLLSDKGYANKAIAEILNKEAWRHVSHVGNPKLMNNVMSAIKIVIPTSIKEQTAIGNYFQKLDTLIEQHQQQITKLNHIKQACLSKMFI